MNYMKQIAKMLGVELGDRFKVTRRDTVLSSEFYITDNGLYEQIRNQSPMLNSPILKDLLIGERKMIKLPWKPKNGEAYYYIDTDDKVTYETFDSSVVFDLALYKLGKLYRTREEAEAHAEEDKAYWDEVRKGLEE